MADLPPKSLAVTNGNGLALPTLQMLDLTPYGRQETSEDSPPGWPNRGQAGYWWDRHGRPVAQWTRTSAAVK